MNEIKIPKSFDVCGKRYTVGYYGKPIIENKDNKTTGWCGFADYNKQRIGISTKTGSGIKRNRDDIDETWCHEFIHVLLDAADYHEMKSNEVFVSRFSKILHQALKTARY